MLGWLDIDGLNMVMSGHLLARDSYCKKVSYFITSNCIQVLTDLTKDN